MKEIGLSPDLVVIGNHRVEGGMNALLELVNRSDPPTAVLCSNDSLHLAKFAPQF